MRMMSFENYMKALVITDAFRTYGDIDVRKNVIHETLNNLSSSNPELKDALVVELNRQRMI